MAGDGIRSRLVGFERLRHLGEVLRLEELQRLEDLDVVSMGLHLLAISSYPFQVGPCQAELLHSLEVHCSPEHLRMLVTFATLENVKHTGITVHIEEYTVTRSFRKLRG